MARAMWSGSISFGLVNIPVRLFSAVHHEEIRFHMLHDKDGGRIKQKRVCSLDEQEVPYEHIVKGYEMSRGSYVMIDPEELQALDPKATRAIDIEDFVDLKEIDPIFYESTYYLSPDRGAAKPYALLLAAMKRTGKVGIARMVMRTKQYLCAIRPMGDALAMSTMIYQDEIVPQEDVEGLETHGTPGARELQMAEQLVGSLSGRWTPEKYKDDYRERVQELIKKKAEGQEIVAPPPEEEPTKVVSLMDALRKSLAHHGGKGEAAAGKKGEAAETGELRHRAHAARTARSKAAAGKKGSSRSRSRSSGSKKGRKKKSA